MIRPAPRGLADTGALLAFLDSDDRWHDRCVAAFARLQLPLATTPAVLAELFHLIGDNASGAASAWRLLRSAAITMCSIGDADLPNLERLMERFADRPMDFADATLVHIAERERLSTIFTIDHNDFETYRIGRRQRFRILPERTP